MTTNADKKSVRDAKLAEALRANLRRRKDQARSRAKPADDKVETGGNDHGANQP